MWHKINILIVLSILLLCPGLVAGQITGDTINFQPKDSVKVLMDWDVPPPCICPSPNIGSIDVSTIEIIEMSSEVDAISLDSGQLARNHTSPLATLLNDIPSVFIKSYGQAGISTPSFRGTGAGHTQVYWNQIPINSPMLGLTDMSLGATGLFDQVSIRFGSNSLLLGPGGIGGAIQLNNNPFQPYNEGEWRLNIGQEIGSFGNYRGHLGSQFRKGKFWMTTQAVSTLGKNDFSFRDISRLDAPLDTLEHSQVQQFSLMQQIGWGSNWKGGTARLWINSMGRELPPTMLTNNLTESQSDRSVRVQLEWRHPFGKWHLNSTLSHSYDWLDYQNRQADIYSTSTSYLNDLNILFNRYENNPGRSTHLQLGGRAGFDVSQSPGYSSDKTRFRAHVHGMLEYSPNNKNQYTILLRETYQNGELTLPYGYFSYHRRFSNTARFHVNLARNYRFPTLNDLYWTPGGNPDLETETAWTTEAGFDKLFLLSWTQNQLTLGTDIYASLINNWIQWVPIQGNLWSPENVQQVFSRGAEVNLQWTNNKRKVKYVIRGGYALALSEGVRLQGASSVSLNKQLIYTPRHTGTVSGQFRYRGANLYLSQQFTSIRYTTSDHSSFLPGYHLGEIRGGYTIGKKSPQLELYGGIRNLWNSEYQAIAWRPMPGRNYYLGLRFHLKNRVF